MRIKKRRIIVDNIWYVYSVIEYKDDIQIRVYLNKNPFLHIHFSYIESWGIDVCRPKTIELLIHYFLQHYPVEKKTKELWLSQEQKLFDILFEYYFTDEDNTLDKEQYLKRITEYHNGYSR